jgi:hypothetical protein
LNFFSTPPIPISLPNHTYLVAPISLVVFPIELATTEKIKLQKKQNEGIARNLELITQAIFKVMINFFVNIGMKILYKPKKPRVYAFFFFGYFIYALARTIGFKLSFKDIITNFPSHNLIMEIMHNTCCNHLKIFHPTYMCIIHVLNAQHTCAKHMNS